ncbi:MAG: hypothetical protein U5L09_20105 [Bacteroidales bacterium]|nr:hypothetical protein [Bacteroidales bacterium]
MKRQLILTEDGSHTIFLPEMQEHYHSTHGAVNESKHVYIDAAMMQVKPAEEALTILEVGFGTGLNALLTLGEAIRQNKKTRYVALEPYPLDPEIYERLNFGEIMDFPGAGITYYRCTGGSGISPIIILMCFYCINS